jgi:hypothetical protein
MLFKQFFACAPCSRLSDVPVHGPEIECPDRNGQYKAAYIVFKMEAFIQRRARSEAGQD